VIATVMAAALAGAVTVTVVVAEETSKLLSPL